MGLHEPSSLMYYYHHPDIENGLSEIKAEDCYYISSDFTFFDDTLTNGDQMISLKDEPKCPDDWVIIRKKVTCFNEWISIKDRLPDESVQYIVCRPTYDILTGLKQDELCSHVAGFDTEENKFYYDGFDRFEERDFFTDVLYWMPLPEPPKLL